MIKRQFLAEKAKKIAPKNKLFKLIVVGVCIVVSIFLIRNIFKLFSVEDRIQTLEDKIATAQKEKENLTERKNQIDTPDFIEYEARDKLGYAKEGEAIVVLPSEDYLKSLVPEIKEDMIKQDDNWKKWWSLFFKE